MKFLVALSIVSLFGVVACNKSERVNDREIQREEVDRRLDDNSLERQDMDYRDTPVERTRTEEVERRIED